MSIGKLVVGVIVVTWAVGAATIIKQRANQKREEVKNV